jgi:hypothetical protein
MRRVAVFSILGLVLASVPVFLPPVADSHENERVKISVHVAPFSFGFTLVPGSVASDPGIGDRTDRLEDWIPAARR